MSHVSMSEHSIKHNLGPRGEEAHLHFRARLSSLRRPLLICSSLPRPSALNANKPKLQESKGLALEFINSLKGDVSKGIYTNTINISQFITRPLSCTVKSSSGNKWCFSPIRLANWLWLFVKIALVGCEQAPPRRRPFSFKRENISTEAFNSVCTNKISTFDQASEYRAFAQWMCQSEVISLSKKLLAKAQERCDVY